MVFLFWFFPLLCDKNVTNYRAPNITPCHPLPKCTESLLSTVSRISVTAWHLSCAPVWLPPRQITHPVLWKLSELKHGHCKHCQHRKNTFKCRCIKMRCVQRSVICKIRAELSKPARVTVLHWRTVNLSGQVLVSFLLPHEVHQVHWCLAQFIRSSWELLAVFIHARS